MTIEFCKSYGTGEELGGVKLQAFWQRPPPPPSDDCILIP